jgi:hypothetical protein
VLVALVLTSSCSAVASLLFRGLISPSIRGTDSALVDGFEVMAARDEEEEDDGIMVSGSGTSAECLHESWPAVASDRAIHEGLGLW